MGCLYKRVSTMLTIMCALYMCLISVFHLGLQTRHWEHQARNDHSLISRGGQYLGHKNTGNWTQEVKRSIRTNQTQTQNLSDPQDREYAHKKFGEDLIRASIISKSITHTSTGDSFHEYRSMMIRRLEELTETKTTVASQERRTRQDKPLLTSTTSATIASQVTQQTVHFLSLGEMYVYGTFLDRRFSESEYIRILILRPAANQTRQLICQFYSARNRIVNVKAELYEMCENHGKKYGGWIYSCSIPESVGADTQTLSLMSVTDNGLTSDFLGSAQLRSLNRGSAQNHLLNKGSKEHTYNSVHGLDIQQTTGNSDSKLTSAMNPKLETSNKTSAQFHQKTHYSPGSTMKLGVCVPPLHGDINLSKIINFIEMCQLLGADKVFLYIHHIPRGILAFLQNYTGSNPDNLSLVLWDLPVTLKTMTQLPEGNQIIWNYGQLLAVQHCLYTNMEAFHWLLFIDIDEMLVPKTDSTWPELISEVVSQFYSNFQNKSIAGISFESAFFQQDFQTQVTNSIDYFQYLHRTRETSRQRSKLFVQPLQIFELGIHHVSRVISDEMSVVRAGTGQGLLHHYRRCVPDDGAMSHLHCEVLIKDETILRYEAPLTIASRRVISGAMEFFAHFR